ncbi:hypothetical protein GMOD_00005743 [Pyrenophora seminiperda CCB06]|uniref:Uncharacterized protein n=1 Tax=Pyrenophora seminiperda CCB06 TaxID=1302712 RepID=A0A3M7MA05_9PLEO|nr:hypothetical protein GMOD_00005743 [Pyrenophora seminiperda CCB06]
MTQRYGQDAENPSHNLTDDAQCFLSASLVPLRLLTSHWTSPRESFHKPLHRGPAFAPEYSTERSLTGRLKAQSGPAFPPKPLPPPQSLPITNQPWPHNLRKEASRASWTLYLFLTLPKSIRRSHAAWLLTARRCPVVAYHLPSSAPTQVGALHM